ncbi:DUF2155 domain-containing protein [Asaia bogorensis]|uniref:DUF2155 domain-containing protein n=1 Tax=Asaia bogorensis TaxID=91915 RepID=UPI002860CC49|nr:DUF2155 domain-containing protein [Asaia bogorensis]MDR6183450.1 hypothetical protein [Asaia bogorensis NBRC 16594]
MKRTGIHALAQTQGHKRVLHLSGLAPLAVIALMTAPSMSALAAEAVAPPVMYPAGLWQGRGEAVIRVLNRTDSHIETMTIPVGGQAQYRSLHLGVTRCVERPETLPSNAAALITTSDDTDPGAHYTGWILAQEPSLGTYKSALYGISVVACSGPKADPTLAPLPQPVVPVLGANTPDSAQSQPGDLNDPSQGSAALPVRSGTLPANGGNPARDASAGPTRLTPLGDPANSSHPMGGAYNQPTRNETSQGQSLPRPPQSPSSGADQGGPMQLAPLSGGPVSNGAPSNGSGQPLPPPQPYGQ